MSKVATDYNLVFYSKYPWDKNSQFFISELSKNDALNSQFKKICIHTERNNQIINPILPRCIKECLKKSQLHPSKLPILAAAGFDNFIYGEDATSWVKTNAFNDHGGLQYGDLNDDAMIAQSCSLDNDGNFTESKLFGDQEFHMTGKSSSGRTGLKNMFSDLGDQTSNERIETYADSTSSRDASNDIESRMAQFKSNRELVFQPQRPGFSGSCSQQAQSQMGGGLQYNPDPRVPVGGAMGSNAPTGTVPKCPW